MNLVRWLGLAAKWLQTIVDGLAVLVIVVAAYVC
jgi:hypothetical protein